MAKWCFSLGIVRTPAFFCLPLTTQLRLVVSSHVLQNLKRVEVVEDDEAEIIEAVQRMSDRYDFVVTR